MRILHVYKDFDPPIRGGIEGWVAQMCRYQRQWAEVEALVCSRAWRTRVVDRDGTRVTEVAEWGRFQGAPASPLFPVYLRRCRADVVVVHVPNPTAEVGWLLARPRGRLVVRYHSDVVRQARAMKVYRPVQVTFLRKAAMILATSQRYVETSATLRSVQDRCRVIPLGIHPAAYQNADAARVESLRNAYGGEYVLFVGRHRYYKGLEYLVRAAGDIAARVVVAGDGPERRRVEALARELNVNVAFPGELTHEALVAHLHGCAVFAFPSVERSEAYGLSILEAHACGKPVVATTLGTGVEFVNVDQETGLNVPPRDAGALAAAVNVLLADAALRRRMGEYARQRVEREFRVDQIARAEFEAYQEAAV